MVLYFISKCWNPKIELNKPSKMAIEGDLPSSEITKVLPALANDDMVTFLDTEAWGDERGNVGVPLLVPARCTVISFLKNIKFHLEEN